MNYLNIDNKMDTLSKIARLHPKIRTDLPLILSNIHSKGISITITQATRTWAEQDALYAQGRTKPGPIVTKAKGGQSFHNFSLAIDFALLHSDGSVSWSITEDTNANKLKDWDEVVQSFLKYGWEHGDRGYFDNPHFQKVFGLTPQQCADKVKNGQVDKDGYILI